MRACCVADMPSPADQDPVLNQICISARAYSPRSSHNKACARQAQRKELAHAPKTATTMHRKGRPGPRTGGMQKRSLTLLAQQLDSLCPKQYQTTARNHPRACSSLFARPNRAQALHMQPARFERARDSRHILNVLMTACTL